VGAGDRGRRWLREWLPPIPRGLVDCAPFLLRPPAWATTSHRLPGTQSAGPAEHPSHVWAIAFQFDQTEDGRRL